MSVTDQGASSDQPPHGCQRLPQNRYEMSQATLRSDRTMKAFTMSVIPWSIAQYQRTPAA